MRNFLNTHRLILHLFLGTAFGDLCARLIMSETSVIKRTETFGDYVDYVVGFPFMLGIPVLGSGLINFLAEEYQLWLRKTSRGFDFKTVLRCALAGVPSGIIFILTRNNKNDVPAIIIDSVVIALMCGYFFWDYRIQKQLKNHK